MKRSILDESADERHERIAALRVLTAQAGQPNRRADYVLPYKRKRPKTILVKRPPKSGGFMDGIEL